MTQLTEQTQATPAPGREPARQHCWECQRRRLVCDSTRPICNRCRTNGIVCPGYGEQQPLRWVKPGRVTARGRRRGRAGGARGSVRAPKNAPDESKADANANAISVRAAMHQTTSMSRDLGDNDKLQSAFDALSLLPNMRPDIINSFIRHNVACENFAGVQASYDYNIEMYARCSPHKLLHGESKFQLPPTSTVQVLPPTLRSLFVIFAIIHQVNKLPRDTGRDVRLQARSAYTFWMCQSIRSLNEDIAEATTRSNDATMTGVLMLLLAGQMMQPCGRWRFHYNGLMKMARLRGGMEKIWNERSHMSNFIQTTVMCEVFGNTTSPSHDQLTELSHPENLDFMKRVWGSKPPDIYIGSICPSSLYVTIIQINHLRALATSGIAVSDTSNSSLSSSLPPTANRDDHLPSSNTAQELLHSILDFSPQSWAETNGFPDTRDHWLLVARVHQSAAVLFCILSLQYLLLLPRESIRLLRIRRSHYDRLLLDLKQGFKYTNFKNCLFWPLVVAGAAAVHGTTFERAFITDLMSDSVKDIGCSTPLLARKLMLEFWRSGKTGWDECFDQPYLFVL
ncbi:fungal-specific transcription factor domain-containing protein [Astrocystis sublimbata]|nr:fungal-specific transcription factor domain-containing protein [Astrocystis sublimbata]